MATWSIYDRNGAYLGVAVGDNSEEALNHAKHELGIVDASSVEKREESEPHGQEV